VSPDRHKKPPVRQLEEHSDRTKAVRDDQNENKQQTAPFAAKNILVITEANHVVLKGQVRSPSEAERIKGITTTMTTKRIEDVLEVTP